MHEQEKAKTKVNIKKTTLKLRQGLKLRRVETIDQIIGLVSILETSRVKENKDKNERKGSVKDRDKIKRKYEDKNEEQQINAKN